MSTPRGSWPLALAALLLMAACASPSPTATPSASGAPTADPTASPTPRPTPEPTATPLVPDDALLPNLVMEPLKEWHVEVRDSRRLLRMTTIFSNYGAGRFELRGGRDSQDAETMSLEQVLYTASGSVRRIRTPVEARFAGDGHEHWHAQGVVTLELSPVGAPASITHGSKIDFCFFDNVRTNEDLDEFQIDGFYARDWCGHPDSVSVRMGLSVGWGDRYGWDFVGQWIDVTGLAGGTYELRATVDRADDFLEADDADNCTMSRFVLPGSGTGQIITVEASGLPC